MYDTIERMKIAFVTSGYIVVAGYSEYKLERLYQILKLAFLFSLFKRGEVN